MSAPNSNTFSLSSHLLLSGANIPNPLNMKRTHIEFPVFTSIALSLSLSKHCQNIPKKFASKPPSTSSVSHSLSEPSVHLPLSSPFELLILILLSVSPPSLSHTILDLILKLLLIISFLLILLFTFILFGYCVTIELIRITIVYISFCL